MILKDGELIPGINKQTRTYNKTKIVAIDTDKIAITAHTVTNNHNNKFFINSIYVYPWDFLTSLYIVLSDRIKLKPSSEKNAFQKG